MIYDIDSNCFAFKIEYLVKLNNIEIHCDFSEFYVGFTNLKFTSKY